jgi:shikimate dehydrogenase
MSSAVIDGRTRLLGIIGDPVAQLRTPALVNPLLATRESGIVAVPMHIAAGALDVAWPAFKRMRNLAGLGVTVPHKGAVVRLCDRLEPAAARVGAVNVIRREPDGTMHGALFDGIGFLRGLQLAGHDPRGRRAFLAGAGGAASAIAFSLAEAGIGHLTIYNRTAARAARLAARLADAGFAAIVSVAETASPAGHDLVINATTLGLTTGDALPLDIEGLAPGMVVVDIVNLPQPTPLLAAAAARGCSVQAGAQMLEQQIPLIIAFIEGDRSS